MASFEDINIEDIGYEIGLIGSVWAGKGKAYVCLFPDAEIDGAIDCVKMNVDEWQTLIRQSDLMEREVIGEAADGKLAKIIIRKSNRIIDQRTSWAVFRRDGYRCRYCGNDKVPLTVDHLVLWEDGGPATEANLVAACRKCNKARGNTEYSEWLKSKFYDRSSRGLSWEEMDANRLLVGTLDAIPRVVHRSKKR